MAGGFGIELKVDKAAQRRLERAMRRLPEKVAGKVVKNAVRAAARPILKAAKQKVPAKHGLLKKSLGVKQKSYGRSGTTFAAIGPRSGFKETVDGKPRNPVNYAHLVEFGTAPHEIPAPQGGLKIGPVHVRGTVQHPGAPPQPFLRPAFDSQSQAAVRKARQKIIEGVNREIKKLR